MTMLEFTGMHRDGARVIRADIEDLVIAGWTGRDQMAMEAHIRELELLGIPRPPRTPVFYRVAASLLTTATRIDVSGGESSGEAEAVIYSLGDGLWVGVGSDHTDRHAERWSVTLSKQACAKPVAPALWRYEDVAAHWDALVLRSWAHRDGARTLYQEGAVAGLRPPAELVHLGFDGADRPPPGTAMFCGTLAVHGGVRPADRFEMELEDPVLGRRLAHSYAIRVLPVEG
jgi:hypothetical protein